MKIGIISDIHGNIDALNCVLEMLEEEVDKYLFRRFYWSEQESQKK